jgi:hypothetical protein
MQTSKVKSDYFEELKAKGLIRDYFIDPIVRNLAVDIKVLMSPKVEFMPFKVFVKEMES